MVEGNYAEAARRMPATIQGALSEPPICETIRYVGASAVNIFLKLEIGKLSEHVGAGEFITKAQCEFIAGRLMDIFPNESLADFKLCFERGAMGQYGAIKFRVDGVLLRSWMEQYLHEKYQAIEDRLMKEKDTPFEIPEPTSDDERAKEWLKRWKESLDNTGSNIRRVKHMSGQDIREEGRIMPKKVEKYPSTPISMVKASELHIQYLRECYDIYTGKPNEMWMPEDEWLEANIK